MLWTIKIVIYNVRGFIQNGNMVTLLTYCAYCIHLRLRTKGIVTQWNSWKMALASLVLSFALP